MMVMLIPAQLVIANVSSKRQMKQRVQGCASRIDSRHTCRRRHHHLFSAMLQDVVVESSFTRTRLSCQENGLVRMNSQGCSFRKNVISFHIHYQIKSTAFLSEEKISHYISTKNKKMVSQSTEALFKDIE